MTPTRDPFLHHLLGLASRKLVERHGVGRGRSWTLGSEAYRRLRLEHQRPVGVGMREQTFEGLLFDELLRASSNGLTAGEMRRWSHYGKAQTTRILKRMQAEGRVVFSGKRGTGACNWLPAHAPRSEGEEV